jgi:hypothetical protein
MERKSVSNTDLARREFLRSGPTGAIVALTATAGLGGAASGAESVAGPPCPPQGPVVPGRGQPGLGPWANISDAIYCAVTSGNPADEKQAMEMLLDAGRSNAEAVELFQVSQRIARKAGSAANFAKILNGDIEVPGPIHPREFVMLNGIAKANGQSGRTWEGSSGGTWEGSSGNTWQGSSSQ